MGRQGTQINRRDLLCIGAKRWRPTPVDHDRVFVATVGDGIWLKRRTQ
jgi:hypothetical protein